MVQDISGNGISAKAAFGEMGDEATSRAPVHQREMPRETIQVSL